MHVRGDLTRRRSVGLDLSVVLETMAVGAQRDCVFDGVVSALAQRPFVMHLQIRRAVSTSAEGGETATTFTVLARPQQDLCDYIWISDELLADDEHLGWSFRGIRQPILPFGCGQFQR